MRVTTYEMRRDKETELPMLVKESSCNYPALSSAKSPDDVWQLMRDVFDLGNAIEEYSYVIAYDNAMKILGVFMVSKGTQTYSAVGMKEIMSRLLMIRAAGCIFIHNHPSGDITPSKMDIDVTKRIKAACELLDMKLFDHIIITKNSYVSFYERQISPFNS